MGERYPHILIEGCSGGGGRFDAGMLYYTPQIWCSDNTDAIERIRIQHGTSFGYPISAVGSSDSNISYNPESVASPFPFLLPSAGSDPAHTQMSLPWPLRFSCEASIMEPITGSMTRRRIPKRQHGASFPRIKQKRF